MRLLHTLAFTLALLPLTPRAATPSGPYAVLATAPATPRTGCRPARAGGELRAPLDAPDTALCPIAVVAGDEILLGELAEALAASHAAMGSKANRGEKPHGMDFGPTLDRIVDVRLLALEAREMGLLDLPESREAMEGFRASTLRTLLQEQASSSARPDPAVVERIFKAAVKEWKVRSAIFEKEEDAKGFRAAIAKGGAFEALARAAVAEKKARSGEPGFVSRKVMLPELVTAADALKAGEVSPPIQVKGGWVVLKLEGVRYPEDAAARARARDQSLKEEQHKAVRAFHEGLVRKYATVDKALLDKLDFEAGGEAAFNALLKDARPLVQIRGEKPITVGELTAEVASKFFHGIADPIKEHRVNPQKIDAFERLVGVRLFAREARERKLDQNPTFQRRVVVYERVLAFDSLIQRAIVPGIKVTEGEVKALYEKRKGVLSTPQMWKLDGLAFASAKGAQAALEKVRAGTDFDWLRANAEGRLKPADQRIQLEGAILSANTLPASMGKALAGAQKGDTRLYATDDGAQHYVLRVLEQMPPTVQPYADAREKLAREVEGEKTAAAIRDYAAKLRKVQKVDVLITRIAS